MDTHEELIVTYAFQEIQQVFSSLVADVLYVEADVGCHGELCMRQPQPFRP